MLYFSRLKTLSVLGLCLLGLIFALPNLMPAPASWMPWRTIHLGLDLRGGSYLMMQVDMAAVTRERLTTLAQSSRQALRNAGLVRYRVTANQTAQRLVVNGLQPGTEDKAYTALQPLAQTTSTGFSSESDLIFSRQPNGSIVITLSPTALEARATAAVQQSIEIVRRRIDDTGVVDPTITRQGLDRIVVELPGIGDPQRIKRLLGKTAKMTFHLTDESANPSQPVAPPDDEFLPLQGQPGQKIAVKKQVAVDGSDLTDARAAQDPNTGQWVVNFTFDSVGTRRFADITRRNVGHPFAIVLDNVVIEAPVIREPILGGSGQISGNFTAQSATDLAVLLRAGALPAPLTIVEERSVGPQLGADAIRAGAISLAVGFVLVILFMGTVYGMYGWFANIALVVNLVMLLGLLSILQATLTLPGMAGILLTLGMAVDANILINERIREEVQNGRTPLAAMETGCKRAYSTIIDSNATTFLAHVMLFIFGTGPIKGFAVTITIGIATSFFTATMLARLLMSRWYATRRPAALPV